DDADILRYTVGAASLIDEQLESSVAGRYRLLIGFAYSAQRLGVERRDADGFDRLRIVFGTAHADDNERAAAVNLAGACGRHVNRRSRRELVTVAINQTSAFAAGYVKDFFGSRVAPRLW